MNDGPNFSTPDVLPTGQTGWFLLHEYRASARRMYRQLRSTGSGRTEAARIVATWLDTFAGY